MLCIVYRRCHLYVWLSALSPKITYSTYIYIYMYYNMLYMLLMIVHMYVYVCIYIYIYNSILLLLLLLLLLIIIIMITMFVYIICAVTYSCILSPERTPGSPRSGGNRTRRRTVTFCPMHCHFRHTRKNEFIHRHHHPEGVVYRSVCLYSSAGAVSEVASRRWWCIESLLPHTHLHVQG